jgi:UDP-N-acetylglucosamine acyltransferase
VIHKSAVIDPSAVIGDNVKIGPYSIIGKDVELGDGCEIASHVVIQGPTKIGKENRIFQFASVGDEPQDKKYAGEPTRLEIGDRNTIREGCTINRGTTQDTGVTKIGDDNWIMAYVHIAHDCVVGNNVILANNTSLAGHVHVGDHAILGGFTLVHQFCSIGAHCFSGMNSVISKDVPPYLMVSGHMASAHGLNSEGLKRRGFSAEALKSLKDAYRVIFRQGNTLKTSISTLEPVAENSAEVAVMLDFLKNVKRGIVR